MKLTDEQKASVLTVEGNVLTMASAGSGKTASFVTRIGHMIKNKGISPSNILAITFTKKASEEMRKRLAKIIGKDSASKVVIGTFHGISFRLLQALDADFRKLKLAPSWWTFGEMNTMCKPYDEKKNPNGLGLGIKGVELGSFISYQKANMITAGQRVIIDDKTSYVDGVSRASLQEAFDRYEQAKSNSRQFDYDDMLLLMYLKLKNDEKFRAKLSNQFKYIMIDEYQDTSSIVLEIIKMINDKNVFVVGDFRQSIYQFINANVDNILNFKDNFDSVKLIELNKNFRSTQNIVNLSNEIIGFSDNEKYKQFKESESVAEDGEDISFTAYSDEITQHENIASKIMELHNNGTDLKEIAILVRTNSQTAIIETVLSDRDIPYEVNKSMSFFDRKEVVDLLSYARLAVNEADDASFRRIYNVPNRYLKKEHLTDLDTFASEKDIHLFQACKISPQNSEWQFKSNVEKLVKIIHELKYQATSGVNAGKMLRNIMRMTKYMQHLNDTSTSPSSLDEKTESVEKLCEIASKFPTIQALLAHVGTIKDKQNKNKGKDSVQIVTIHSSKGLEWDAVFVPNANEGLIPHDMNDNVEEERRLFYVACSRPRKNLYVSWNVYGSDLGILKEGLFITELVGVNRIKEMKREILSGKQNCEYLKNCIKQNA